MVYFLHNVLVDGQDIITPEFHLKMKDNSFYIVPKD